jgi:hypothetical protein
MSFLCHFEVILKSFLCHFYVIFMSFLCHFYVIFIQTSRGLANAPKGQFHPKASNMEKFTWNDNLAQAAHNWANQCNFEHDTNDNRSVPGFRSVGQNLFWKSGSGSKIPTSKKIFIDAIKAWFDESLDYPIDYIDNFKITKNAQTGHFTTMVWAESNQVSFLTFVMLRLHMKGCEN